MSNPFAYLHFLEKIDRDWLVDFGPKSSYLEDLLLKNALRMFFERYVDTFKGTGKKLSCFICFALEKDVTPWLKNTLVPDLERAGVETIFSPKDLQRGKNPFWFEEQISKIDQVVVICIR